MSSMDDSTVEETAGAAAVVSQPIIMQPHEVEESVAGPSKRTCPTCARVFSCDEQEFHQHLLACVDIMVDEDTTPVAETGQMDVMEAVESMRLCPICNRVFSSETSQKTFEDHVYEHFADEFVAPSSE